MTHRLRTRLLHAGRPDPNVVNPPVYHASTILFPDYAAFRERESAPLDRRHMYYGRMGTPTTRSLEDALCELDGAVGAVLSSSGVASIAGILRAFLAPGDRLLMVDSAYGPTRNFCTKTLAERGVETVFYDPLTTMEELASLINDRTRMIFLESPGSATFEVQDVPAITALARDRGILTAIDNTWATPLYFNPLAQGVDLAMQSGTKYLNGHADCLFGVVTTRDPALYQRLQHDALAHGMHLAPDDAMLALRGLRTLPLRLPAHEAAALEVANWLSEQPLVTRVLHPAFETCPGHTHWRRDFSGSSGLFSAIIKVGSEPALAQFIDSLTLFGLGFSWGGFESLALPMWPTRICSTVNVAADEALVRFHIGLEDTADLIADLSQAFQILESHTP
ncbi:MAG: cystathionine beta-lyase [Halieaceae bacterium]|jgi:cystathionine beta-lyase|nr:cystathionine beta-lyase [Halieaceae bacterium]